jgi:hypothetical protein
VPGDARSGVGRVRALSGTVAGIAPLHDEFMSVLRDYQAWHEQDGDANSGLSWRLRTVQGRLNEALDRCPGSARVLSACSGDGRDILGVLSERNDAERVSVTLIEIHPEIAGQARDAARSGELAGVDIRIADAGCSDAYADAVPADVVLLVGVFGNISDADLERTIGAAGQLCRPGATLLWTRARAEEDRNDVVRSWFARAGFTELGYDTREDAGRPAVGVMRYDGPVTELVPGRRLFTFVR